MSKVFLNHIKNDMTLDAIGIACQKIKKSIEFYELLNVKFKEFGQGHFEGTSASGIRIMLDSFELIKKIHPNWKKPSGSGVTLCFLQNNSFEVDQTHQKIIQAGFLSEKEPWDAFWGQRYACVQDPDGNQVDLFAPL